MNETQLEFLEGLPEFVVRAAELPSRRAARRSPAPPRRRSLRAEVERRVARPQDPHQRLEAANRELLQQRCDF
ncbi:MAG: hypothetical protein IT424_06420 [Pirellulales bacterium]|nr:hypothetical protein [Pirellulales bacterium]